jgi:outer membrane protein
MGKFYNGILALLTLAVGVLFYLILFKKEKIHNQKVMDLGGSFPIAVFEPDSIINNYKFSTESQKKLEEGLAKANDEIGKLEVEYESKRQQYEAMPPSDEKEKALMALQELKQQNENKKEVAQQNLDLAKQKFQIELRKNIEDFIKKFNTPKRFSFIMVNEPGLIYYRDSMLDITKDIIDGLNKGY